MNSCRRCGADNADDARFCQRCGAALESPHAAGDVRKTVTVLFSDVVSSTELGETLDAERLRSVITRYFAAARHAIEAHGGTVEKFIGDAVMAVFGVPAVHEDDAVRAVRAAVDVRAAVQRLSDELVAAGGSGIAVRIGVNTGEVIVGDPGTAETFVTGDAVNVAARLQSAAGPMEVVVGQATQRLLRDAAEVEPLPDVDARGKAQPVRAFRLRSVRPAASELPQRADSPLIGRSRELRRLRQAYEDAVFERRAELFTLLGTAGVGKSRLVAEFLVTVPREALVLRGRCLPYGQGITYWAVGEAVRAAAGISEADSATEAREALARLLAAGSASEPADAERATALLAAAVGLSSDRATPDEIAWAIRYLLERLAASAPLIVVFEDIHWAEPTFLDAIERVVDLSRGYAILLVCPARPELMDLRPTWGGGKLNATTMLLEPLPPDDADALIGSQPGAEALPRSLRERIAAAAEGNPLFVEEMLAMLVDEGVVALEDGRWIARRDLEHVTVPPTIRVLLAARLDSLVPDERAIATRAAVAGRVFERDAAVALAPDALRASVPVRLMELVRKELLRPERAALTAGEAFKFRHVLIRDAAYESLPKSERAELHERFAGWLEEAAGDRVTEYEEILGYHLEQAHDYRLELGLHDAKTAQLAERAGQWLGGAGARALARQDIRAAVNLLRRASRLLPVENELGARYRYALGDALLYGGDYRGAEETLDTVVTAPSTPPVLAAQARVLGLRIRRAERPITHRQVRDELAVALWRVRHEAPLRLRVQAWDTAADAAQDAGDMVGAERGYRIAYRLAERTGDRSLIASAGLSLASHGLRTAWPVAEARALCEQILATPDLPVGERAFALGTLGVLLALEGRFEEARESVAESRAIREEVGLGLGYAAIEAGMVELLAANYAEAERQFRMGRDDHAAGGATSDVPWLDSRLAQLLMLQDRDAEALPLVEGALRADSNNRWIQVFGGTTRARLLARAGRIGEAIEAAETAIAVGRRARLELLPHVFGSSLEDLGYIMTVAGRLEEADAAYAEALALYERKGIVPFIERVRAARDELRERARGSVRSP